MTTLSILPLHYEIEHILSEMVNAGVTNHFGYGVEVDGIHLRYQAANYDAVQAILNAYPVQYANEVMRPQMIDEAAAIRWEKQQVTTFNGAPLPCDQTTINLVDATRNSMIDAPTSPQFALWKTGRTSWATLDASTLLGMGLAIRSHIQACFQREKDLQDQIIAAANVDALRLIDITTGWPV